MVSRSSASHSRGMISQLDIPFHGICVYLYLGCNLHCLCKSMWPGRSWHLSPLYESASTVSPTMTDLTGEFCCLQDDFLAAVIEGDDAMADFASRISHLERTYNINARHHILSEGCERDIVHNATFGVATLATSFIELELESEKISSAMVSEIEGIFSRLSLLGGRAFV